MANIRMRIIIIELTYGNYITVLFRGEVDWFLALVISSNVLNTSSQSNYILAQIIIYIYIYIVTFS